LISPTENERAKGLVSSEEGDKDQVPLEEEQDGHGEEPCEEIVTQKAIRGRGKWFQLEETRVSSSLQIEKLG